MAFLLPLEALAGFISAGAVEAGISSEVAGVAGGLVAGKVGSEANKLADSLIPESVKQSASAQFDLLNALSNPYETKNINYLINRSQKNQESRAASKVVKEPVKEYIPVIAPNSLASLLVSHATGLAMNNVTKGTKLELTDHKGDAVIPTGTNEDVIKNIASEDKLGLLEKLSNFYADKAVDDSEEFQKIYKVYNGVGFEPKNVVISVSSDSWVFDMYDEVGVRIHLEQRFDAVTIPNVYGNFGGLRSSNREKPIDVPDTCFMAHDADYAVSMFHTLGDQKLVSRLLNRRADWPRDSIKLLNSIVIYFSTIGASISKLKGSITGDPVVSVEDVTDDIFPVINPSLVGSSEYVTLRQDFYKQFETSVKSGHKEFFENARNTFSDIYIELA